jgi:hypothetical protein
LPERRQHTCVERLESLVGRLCAGLEGTLAVVTPVAKGGIEGVAQADLVDHHPELGQDTSIHGRP